MQVDPHLGDKDPFGCRWVFGDPRSRDWRFCQCATRFGKSYCDTHEVKARVAIVSKTLLDPFKAHSRPQRFAIKR